MNKTKQIPARPTPTPMPKKPKPVVTTREGTQEDFLAIKLSGVYKQLVQKEEQVFALQQEIARLKVAAANRERVLIEEKYGFDGEVKLSGFNADGKRILTMTKMVMEKATTPEVPDESVTDETTETPESTTPPG